MIVWDRGTWVPMGDAEAEYRKGTLKFRLSGEKLGGGWMLVRLKPKAGERGDNWLLIKERDPFARPGEGDVLLEERPESVLSGRLVEELRLPEERRRRRRRAARRKPVKVAALAGAAPRRRCRTQLRPQLATPAARVPDGEEWLHEIKFDGYRTIARLDGRRGPADHPLGPRLDRPLRPSRQGLRGAALQAGADRRRGRGPGRARHRELRGAAGRARGGAHPRADLLRLRSASPRWLRPDGDAARPSASGRWSSCSSRSSGRPPPCSSAATSSATAPRSSRRRRSSGSRA